MKAVSVLPVVVALSMAATTATAAIPADKCEAGKNLAAGKYAACVAKAEMSYVLTGDETRYGESLSKCETKFANAWATLEAKAVAAGGACPDGPDAPTVGEFLDVCVQQVAEAVSGGEGIDLCSAEGNLYSIAIYQTDTQELGALQIELNYAAAGGTFTGTGGSVACDRTMGILSAFNDIEATQLNAGWITLDEGPGPFLLTLCEFSAADPPSASDFVVTIVDSVDENGNSVPTTVGVTVARKL